MTPFRLVLLLSLGLAACSAATDVDAGPTGGGRSGVGGGSGGGGSIGTGGGSAGGGGGGSSADAAVPRAEGETCRATSDCLSGLQCQTLVTASGATSRCTSCSSAGQNCGDGGRCIAVLSSSGSTVSCTFGAPGEPCSSNADCRSNDCQVVVTAAGTRSTCR